MKSIDQCNSTSEIMRLKCTEVKALKKAGKWA
jgi:hypothetical protein